LDNGNISDWIFENFLKVRRSLSVTYCIGTVYHMGIKNRPLELIMNPDPVPRSTRLEAVQMVQSRKIAAGADHQIPGA